MNAVKGMMAEDRTIEEIQRSFARFKDDIESVEKDLRELITSFEREAKAPTVDVDGRRELEREITEAKRAAGELVRRISSLERRISAHSEPIVWRSRRRRRERPVLRPWPSRPTRRRTPMDDESDDPRLEDEDAPQPEVARIRRKVHSAGRDGRVRSKTIAPKRLTRDERRLSELLVYPDDVERPGSREACQGMPRPCPFVSCSHHLYLDVNPETGAIKLNFPHLEVWEMAETCSLDVADRGGITLEEVGAILNLTRERIRQVEVRGLCKIKDHTGGELGLPPERNS